MLKERVQIRFKGSKEKESVWVWGCVGVWVCEEREVQREKLKAESGKLK
jgi:hypothetical protein